MIRVEGRPFHLAAAALLRHLLGPHQLAGLLPARGSLGCLAGPVGRRLDRRCGARRSC